MFKNWLKNKKKYKKKENNKKQKTKWTFNLKSTKECYLEKKYPCCRSCLVQPLS